MAGLDDIIGASPEDQQKLYWINKDISFWVTKTDLDPEGIIAIMKWYPQNSEEDKAFQKDLPDDLAGLKINGQTIKQLAPEGLFKKWGRANKGTKLLIDILRGLEGTPNSAEATALFGDADGEAVLTGLIVKAQTSFDDNGKVLRAEVWDELFPEIKSYVAKKEAERQKRAEAKKKAEAKGPKKAPKKAPKRAPKGKAKAGKRK